MLACCKLTVADFLLHFLNNLTKKMTILAPVNSRAKFPQTLRDFSKQWQISHSNILSTNPKTEKSDVQTYILHLAPAETSGFNVCPNAQNCKKICLHFAGNPVYMEAKQAARIRRTHAFYADQNSFMLTIVAAILHNINKQKDTEPVAIRLNGTSDICWENIEFSIDAEFSRLLNVKFGIQGNYIGDGNIFSLFQTMQQNIGRRLVWFYDYTKLSRNWQKCASLDYHLTFSFDGWDNLTNLKIAKRALENGINVAAAFMVKKGSPLPSLAETTKILGGDSLSFLPVHDGDLSDFRPADPSSGHIIGLRFKLPHGIKYTAAEKQAFCM